MGTKLKNLTNLKCLDACFNSFYYFSVYCINLTHNINALTSASAVRPGIILRALLSYSNIKPSCLVLFAVCTVPGGYLKSQRAGGKCRSKSTVAHYCLRGLLTPAEFTGPCKETSGSLSEAPAVNVCNSVMGGGMMLLRNGQRFRYAVQHWNRPQVKMKEIQTT